MKINCAIHAKEMRLLGLKRQLSHPGLTKTEKEKILREIDALERELGLQLDSSPLHVRTWRSDS